MIRRILHAVQPWPRHPIDVQYGIETSGKVFRLQLKTGNAAADRANNGYAGSQPSIIRRALDQLPERGRGADLIDLGCGKGRVLTVATEYPFATITGIELARSIARVAERNARRMMSRWPERPAIEIVCGDATRPAMSAEGDVVLFLYNPFGGALMAQLVDHLVAHLNRSPRLRMFVIYYNPANAAYFDSNPAFKRFFAERINMAPDEPAVFGNDFDSVVIWQAGIERQAPPCANAEREVEVRIPNRAAVVHHEPSISASRA